MGWKTIHLLKYLIILLFCFEIAVAGFSGIPSRNSETPSYESKEAEKNVIDNPSLLFISEPVSEEQVEKEVFEASAFFLATFSELIKFKPVLVTWVFPENKVTGHPPLFTLFHVLLI